MFDGLNAYMLIKYPNDSCVCEIQIKSRQYNGKILDYNITRNDAKFGQKYQYCLILAVMMERIDEIQLEALNTFNQVPKVQV